MTEAEDLAQAVKTAGFRVSKDARGACTLSCLECGRDNGFHAQSCTKSAAHGDGKMSGAEFLAATDTAIPDAFSDLDEIDLNVAPNDV
jgi:hypothetical protein